MEREQSKRRTTLRVSLAFVAAFLGTSSPVLTAQTILDKFSDTSIPPRTSLLLSGTSDTGALELCNRLGLIATRTSPSSFICSDSPARRIVPGIPNIERALWPPEPIVYTVQPNDTVSEIVAKIFGTNEAYGEHFAKAVLANAGLLSEKSAAAKWALEMIKEHPEWTTPRTSPEAWRAYMDAAGLINPGDRLILQ